MRVLRTLANVSASAQVQRRQRIDSGSTSVFCWLAKTAHCVRRAANCAAVVSCRPSSKPRVKDDPFARKHINGPVSVRRCRLAAQSRTGTHAGIVCKPGFGLDRAEKSNGNGEALRPFTSRRRLPSCRRRLCAKFGTQDSHCSVGSQVSVRDLAAAEP